MGRRERGRMESRVIFFFLTAASLAWQGIAFVRETISLPPLGWVPLIVNRPGCCRICARSLQQLLSDAADLFLRAGTKMAAGPSGKF